MFESALIVFREGLESFLIIALIVAYLRQTGKISLTPAVYGGAVAALVFSAAIGVVTDELTESPFSEGILALISGALVASLTIHVMRTAKTIRSSVTSKIDTHIAKATIPALIGLFLFTFLMVAREGIETALMLSSLAQDSSLGTILGGTAIGLCATALIGFLWVRYAHLINLKLFLQTTGVFLIAFALHIALYGLHELSEADALPFVDNFEFHTATEIIEPNSATGQILLYAMIAVPCVWLAYGIIQDKLKKMATPY
jgi:high-affinity iron transporter